MASVLIPHFHPSKPHFHTRIALRSAVVLRAAARMESSAAVNATAESATTAATEDTVVQYVVLRRDLIDTWPLGSVVTQGCHASVAAIWTHKDDPDTLSYCSPPNLDSMHKRMAVEGIIMDFRGVRIVRLYKALQAGEAAALFYLVKDAHVS